MITIKNITKSIEELAPLNYAEDFDNVGLLVGDYDTEVTGVLVTLDTLEHIVEVFRVNNWKCHIVQNAHALVILHCQLSKPDVQCCSLPLGFLLDRVVENAIIRLWQLADKRDFVNRNRFNHFLI